MAQNDSPMQQALRLSQEARALGRYNEATVILDDYFIGSAEARFGITARIEFTINYLAQGYLRRAYETLHNRPEETCLVGDARDPEQALFNLLVAAVEFRYGKSGLASVNACEIECSRVWEEHLGTLQPDRYTETHVRIVKYHRRRELIMFAPGQT